MPGQAVVTIGSKQWQVSLATTYDELTQGLGGLDSIPPQTGMLFDMGHDQDITVTTEPMLFPLDIVFISSGMKVVRKEENVSPGYLVNSEVLARYFLEVNAGEAEGVEIGDDVSVQIQEDTTPAQPVWLYDLIGAAAAFTVFIAMIGFSTKS